MGELFRESYFSFLKLLIILVLEALIVFDTGILQGAMSFLLLFLAFFVASASGVELLKGKWHIIALVTEVLAVCVLTAFNSGFLLLLSISVLDGMGVVMAMRIMRTKHVLYYLLAFIPFIFIKEIMAWHYLIIILLVIIVHFQHAIIIKSYNDQLRNEMEEEEKLKGELIKKHERYIEVLKDSRANTENRILEEKNRLSQVLHDKLGHSINGSLYQLEACKVLLENDIDKEQVRKNLQAIIDNLRGSMDEIRAALRHEKSEAHNLALPQLKALCDNCKDKYDIDAELVVEGNCGHIPANLWEVILDSTFEAFSNALKYSKCTQIKIYIIVMNKLVRCTVADNGIGAESYDYGMGLTGIRKRVREVNGFMDIEGKEGFVINMLLPLENVGMEQ